MLTYSIASSTSSSSCSSTNLFQTWHDNVSTTNEIPNQLDPFCTSGDGFMFDDLLSNMPSTSRDMSLDDPPIHNDLTKGSSLSNRKQFRKKLSKIFNRIFLN